MSSVCKSLPLTSGVFIVVFLLSAVSAQKNHDLSSVSDFEPIDEMQDLLRKVQLLFEMKTTGKMRQGTVPESENDVAADPNVQCSCSGLECSCCHEVVIRSLGFSKNCCLRVTYVHTHAVIRVSLTLGYWTLFSKEVRASQPPPVCVSVTQISSRTSVCIEFRNFHFGDKSLSGCSTFKASAWGWTLLTLDLGCFQMQVPNANHNIGEEKLPYLEGGYIPVKDPELI